jgi:Tfp pilus assembly protein PilV
MIDTFLSRLPKPRSQRGDTLIEVVISALLVGIIVVGTLTGFGALDHASAEGRQHSEAIALADQSQEQLRSDPASALEKLKAEPHVYTQTVGGTKYAITQSAELQPQSGSSATCSVTEKTRQSGNAFSITSTVTWHQQEAGHRKPVIAAGVITPPIGSALEIDANNAPLPTGGVYGVRAVVKYTPASGGSGVTLEETTGSEGCVVFGDIPATEATVEIPELAGFVTRSGASKYPSLEVSTEEVKLAPNYTTHHEILYNRGGAIEAKFSYNKETGVHKHPNNENKGAEVDENITGDTFVAFNADMASAPDFELGSANITKTTAPYNPEPGTYATTALTPKILFPFPEGEKKPWNVYAGDCPENNPEKLTGEKPPTVYVNPGEVTSATIPTSYVTLNLYKASEREVNKLVSTERWKYLETGTTPYPVTITNLKCATYKPPNNEAAINYKHKQNTTTGKENGGHLEDPFQPFGEEFTLCLAASGKTYTRKYEDKEAPPKGPVLPIYMGQKSSHEKETLRIKEEKEEEEIKTARIKEEEKPKIKREEKEAETRKEAEKKEGEGKLPAAYSSTTTYALGAEVSESGKLYESIKAANKGHTPKTSSTWWKLITRAEVESKRKSEEATTKANAEKAEEAEKKPAREAAEGKEKETETNRKNEEKAEATEAATSGVTVETASSCP